MKSKTEEEVLDLQLNRKPSLAASRRNFIAGARDLVAAAVAVGLTLSSSNVRADRRHDDDDDHHDHHHDDDHKNARCYLAGTHILTPEGEVEISELKIGDAVMTASGVKPIKWVARRHLTREPLEAWPSDVLPVKISRFSLDAKTPHSDLYVSKAHSLHIHGLLIPAHNLINGRSILAVDAAHTLTLDYYHIELECHDVIFAEGAASETLLASNGREGFDNAAEYASLYDEDVENMVPFAPTVSLNGGRQELMSRVRSVVAPIYDARKPLDIIRDQIADRAELRLAA